MSLVWIGYQFASHDHLAAGGQPAFIQSSTSLYLCKTFFPILIAVDKGFPQYRIHARHVRRQASVAIMGGDERTHSFGQTAIDGEHQMRGVQ